MSKTIRIKLPDQTDPVTAEGFSHYEDAPPRCGICGTELDQPNDPMTLDCGGDCRACVEAEEEDFNLEDYEDHEHEPWSDAQGHLYDEDAVCLHCGFDGAEHSWWAKNTYEGMAASEEERAVPPCPHKEN